MRTIAKTVYNFDELSDSAKKRACIDWRTSAAFQYAWDEESLQSIREFCDAFGVKLKNYSAETWGACYAHTDATNANFRGLKLRDVDRDNMPTGYCLDCDLWMTFYDEFKRTGSALKAFEEALGAAVRAWRDDREHQESDDHVADFLAMNEFEFTENGQRV
jgi:hypothetical protein